ncbi:hypothetical protein B0H13DRAFT_2302629 [Mycena leptocephala]|nr:hypothetical protein B0H13DRAFT_2302629 [Mycena leptocephala]
MPRSRLSSQFPCQMVNPVSDEDEFLRRKELELEQSDDTAHMAISACYDAGRMKRFWKLAKTRGFTGCILPGVSKEARVLRRARRRAEEKERQEQEGTSSMDVDNEEEEEEVVTVNSANHWVPPSGEDLLWQEREDGEDEGDEEADREVAEMVYELAKVSVDGKGQQEGVEEEDEDDG